MGPRTLSSSLVATFVLSLWMTHHGSVLGATTGATGPSTQLRHLQIVFRHGDRAPLAPLFPNDPFVGAEYWPHGLDQLTTTGRARMFRLGQVIRERYADYLGGDFSPREVFARSSAIDRCLESAQLVLAGAYPPNSTFWQWDINGSPLPLSTLWQPIPVTSFLPPNDDTLLRINKPCPHAETERATILSSPPMRALIRDNAALLREVTTVSGYRVDEILEADRFHENLNIEHQAGLYWSDLLPTTGYNWTRSREIEIISQLKKFVAARWNNEFNSTLIQRTRAGELLNTIGDNFHQKKSVLDLENRDQNKLVLFSTHDTKLAVLLAALNLWTGILIPYGSMLFFELHQSTNTSSEYFVALHFLNDTMGILNSTDLPNSYPLTLPDCAPQTVLIGGIPMCPLDRFAHIVGHFKVDNWDVECGIESQYSSGTYLAVINLLLLVANLVVFFALLLLIMYLCTRIKSRAAQGYQRLD